MRSPVTVRLILLVCIGLCVAAFLVFISAGPTADVRGDEKTYSHKAPAKMKDTSLSEFNAEDNGIARKRVPDAIVVGAGKCGTDAIITYLNTSSSFVINTLHGGGTMELNYFNKNYDKGTQWYTEQMPAVKDNQVLIEKCAPYFWNPEVPARVYKLKPDMKLIMVLCDPVKRLVSLYSHINSYKLEDGSDPLPSFNDLIQIKDGKLIENVHPRPLIPFLQTGMYSEFVSNWLGRFPLEQMVFISGEELIKDPLKEVDKVTQFLGKPHSITSSNIYFDEERGFYCFKGSDGSKFCMNKSTKGRKHPNLSADLLKALQDYFRTSNEKLESLVGVQFGWPKYFGKH